MTARGLAIVLSGGAALGALQVGALQALMEAGLRPDLLVGTSAGALNATYLALHGWNAAALEGLRQAWESAPEMGVVPRSVAGLRLRLLLQLIYPRAGDRRREFYTAHGLRPDLRFRDLQGGLRLIQVAANLTNGRAFCYGTDPDHNVLEGLLASTAFPPWGQPLRNGAGMLVDGAAFNNLPIQPALAEGASAIVALDLSDELRAMEAAWPRPGFWLQWLRAMRVRQAETELELAKAQGVPVAHIRLVSNAEQAMRSWDFSRPDELFAEGYRTASLEVAWPSDLLSTFRPQSEDS